MKKFVLALFATLSISNAAFADCWMQCMAHNPFNGKCVAKTKMCNISDTENAIKHLGDDVGAAYANLKDEWTNIYGILPEQLRYAFDKYPLTEVALFHRTL